MPVIYYLAREYVPQVFLVVFGRFVRRYGIAVCFFFVCERGLGRVLIVRYRACLFSRKFKIFLIKKEKKLF